MAFKFNPFTGTFDIVNQSVFTEIDDGNSGTSDTIDFSAGPFHKSTLTGNVTYTFTNPPSAGLYVLKTIQGAGPYGITWDADVLWPGGIAPALSQGSGDVDLHRFYFDGTKFYGLTGFDFS